MRRFRPHTLLFGALAAVAMAAPRAAAAQVLYTNGTPDGVDGFSVSPFSTQTDRFAISDLSATVGSFQWYAFAAGFPDSPTVTADYRWSILADNSGSPGTFIANGNVTGALGTNTGVFCCSGSNREVAYFFDQSIAPLTLGLGYYWLTIDSYDDASLGRGYWAESGRTGSAEYSFDGGQTFTPYSDTGLAFSISGPETASVTPEPATLTLLATGLVGMVGVGSRRRKKGNG